MPGGNGIRRSGHQLDLDLGAGTGLRRLEAICRLRGAGGPEELASAHWDGQGSGWTARLGPIEFELEQRRRRDGIVELRWRARAGEPAVVEQIGIRGMPLTGGEAPAWFAANGYQSWDDVAICDAGTGSRARTSWWTAGAAREAGAAIGLAAASAVKLATRFDWLPGTGLSILQVTPPAAGSAPPAWRARRGARLDGVPVAVAAGDDLATALELAAGGTAKRRQPAPRGWLSWYHHGAWVAREDVIASAGQLREEPFRELGLDVVQIDDGWQQAYGDWLPNTKFGALDAVCAELRQAGQVPGVWTAPFLVSVASGLCDTAPPDWFVQDAGTGEPVIDPRHYVFGPMRVLDARRQPVRGHLERVFRHLREQGFTYFKIDFLYAGAYAGLPALRAGVRAIRRGIGPDAYLLACGAPLLPVRGLVDGCRIGPDTCTPFYDFELGQSKPTFFGDEIQAVANAVALRRHLRGWYDLDPDVALAGGGLEPGRARQLITAVALCGGLYFLGDALAELGAEQRELVGNVEIAALPAGGPARAALDFDPAGRPPARWSRDDGVVAIFNWTRDPVTAELAAEPGGHVRDLWNRSDLPAPGDRLEVEIAPQDVRVFRLGGGRL